MGETRKKFSYEFSSKYDASGSRGAKKGVDSVAVAVQRFSDSLSDMPMHLASQRMAGFGSETAAALEPLKNMPGLSEEVSGAIGGIVTSLQAAAEGTNYYERQQKALASGMQQLEVLWRKGILGRKEYKQQIDLLRGARGRLLDMTPKEIMQEAQLARQQIRHTRTVSDLGKQVGEATARTREEMNVGRQAVDVKQAEADAVNRVQQAFKDLTGTKIVSGTPGAEKASSQLAELRLNLAGLLQSFEEGAIGAKELNARLDKLAKPLKEFGTEIQPVLGASEKMTVGFGNMEDAARRVRQELGKHTSLMQRLNRGWKSFGARVKNIGRYFVQMPARIWDRIRGARAPRAAEGVAGAAKGRAAGQAGGITARGLGLMAMIGYVFRPIVDMLRETLVPALEALRYALEPLMIPFQQLFVTLIEALTPLFAKFAVLLTELAEAVMPLLIPVINAIVFALKGFVALLQVTVLPIIKGIAGAFEWVVKKLYSVPVIGWALKKIFGPLGGGGGAAGEALAGPRRPEGPVQAMSRAEWGVGQPEVGPRRATADLRKSADVAARDFTMAELELQAMRRRPVAEASVAIEEVSKLTAGAPQEQIDWLKQHPEEFQGFLETQRKALGQERPGLVTKKPLSPEKQAKPIVDQVKRLPERTAEALAPLIRPVVFTSYGGLSDGSS